MGDRELSYLLQRDILDSFIPGIGKGHWQPVYGHWDEASQQWGVFSALIEPSDVPKVLQRDSWDLHVGHGNPGFSQHYENGKEVTTYNRVGGYDSLRPFVIVRDFHGAWPSYSEVGEEFRLFHNLAHDARRGLLLDFEDSGYEIEVARWQKKAVEVDVSYLKRFLAAVQLDLVLYFDIVRYSNVPLERVPEADQTLIHMDLASHYRLDVVEADHFLQARFSTFSRLLGKVIIAAPPIETCGVWPYKDEEEGDVEFIIGADDNGKPITYTSNPDALNNAFGAKPGAPDYLTAVYFRKDVLTKYYADSARYSISDGYLACLSLWGVQIDNNHPTHVVMFLGDLGRDLPYKERLHWKQFNVLPEGGISAVNFRRSLLNQFTDPSATDLVFKLEYRRLVESWSRVFEWPLFLPTEGDDEHLLRVLRVPITNSQAEFDDQVITLARLLVDSLNEKAIEKAIGPGPAGEKGISKFERFLKGSAFCDTPKVVRVLRDLQELRSAGSGHRKGSQYRKVIERLDLDLERKQEAMGRILTEATEVLVLLRVHIADESDQENGAMH